MPRLATSHGHSPHNACIPRVALTGTMILMSLNFLVAVDVIETLIKPAALYKLVDLYKLAIVAGVHAFLVFSHVSPVVRLRSHTRFHCHCLYQ